MLAWPQLVRRRGTEWPGPAEGEKGYVAEKAESETGWLFPVGDEAGALGYVESFRDMLDRLDNGEFE